MSLHLFSLVGFSLTFFLSTSNRFAAATFDWGSWTTEDQFASTLGPNL